MPSSKRGLLCLLLLGYLHQPGLAQAPAGGQYGPEPAPIPADLPAGPEPAGIDQVPAGPTPAYEFRPVPPPAVNDPTLLAPPSPTPSPVSIERPVPPAAAAPAGAGVTSPWTVLSQARQMVREGHPAQALPQLRQFIAERPLEPEGYFWEGVALDNLNQLDAAWLSYQKSIAQVLLAGMDCAELRMNAGNVLLKQGKSAAAVEQYKRAEQIDPRLGLAQLNLGRALLLTGDASGALACFQRCDQLHFAPLQLAYYRAKALLKNGKPDEAREQLRSALAKMPAGHETALKINQEFAELLRSDNGAAFGTR